METWYDQGTDRRPGWVVQRDHEREMRLDRQAGPLPDLTGQVKGAEFWHRGNAFYVRVGVS